MKTLATTVFDPLRIKADALGLKAEDYENDRVLITELYTGMIEFPMSPEKLAAFFESLRPLSRRETATC